MDIFKGDYIQIVTGRGNSVSVRVSPDSADGIAKLHELSSTPAIL